MESYELRFKQSVAKDLRLNPRADVQRILKRIETLRTQSVPTGAENLTGQNRYRLRQDLYRILYGISARELIITVVKVGHRSQDYRSS